MFASRFGAAIVASGGGTPDLGAPIRAAPKSGVDDLRVEGDRSIEKNRLLDVGHRESNLDPVNDWYADWVSSARL